MRAILSVSDKSGLVELARGLAAHGIELISTGGTARAIADAGMSVLNVSDVCNPANKTGALTSTALTGLNMAGITYGTIEAVNIGLGTGNNSLTINGTIPGSTVATGGPGNDIFNIQATGGAAQLKSGAGNATFNVGSLTATAGVTVSTIGGSLLLDGSGGTARRGFGRSWTARRSWRIGSRGA